MTARIKVQSFFPFALADTGLMARREKTLKRRGVKLGEREHREIREVQRELWGGENGGGNVGDDGGENCPSEHGSPGTIGHNRPRDHHYTPPEINATEVPLHVCSGCGCRVSLSPCVICAGMQEARRTRKTVPWWESERRARLDRETAGKLVGLA